MFSFSVIKVAVDTVVVDYVCTSDTANSVSEQSQQAFLHWGTAELKEECFAGEH